MGGVTFTRRKDILCHDRYIYTRSVHGRDDFFCFSLIFSGK